MNAWLETRRAFVIIFALGLFAMAARNAVDPDLWWHLRTGQVILQDHHVLRADPFSFTRHGHTWLNHEWLADVFIFSVYRYTGWAGLILSFAVITTAALLLVFQRCSGKPYLAALFTAWGAIASVPSWGVRPQMLSFLLASLLLLLLDKARTRPILVWWAVPIIALWVNLHAGYALGLGLMAIFLVGGIADVAFGFEEWKVAAPRLRDLALALLACLAVVPLNPNGSEIYRYPFQTLSSRAMQAYIQEWFSPDFHQAQYAPFLLLLLAGCVLLAAAPRRPKPSEVLLLAVGTYAALRSVRHIPLYVLVGVPIFSGMAQAVLDRRRKALSPSTNLGKRLANAFVLALVLFLVGAQVRRVIVRQPQAEARSFPSAAVDFITRERPPGPILNHYNWGGYLIWRLYPDYPVFIDGRADLYGDTFLDDFASIYYVRGRWEDLLAPWDIRTVLLPPDAPLVAALRLKGGWKEIYSDSQAVILTRAP